MLLDFLSNRYETRGRGMSKKIISILILICLLNAAGAEELGVHVRPDQYLKSCFPTLEELGPVPPKFDKPADTGELEIWFGRICCCDGFVLRCGGETMMIDGGDRTNGGATKRFLRLLGVRHVNYLFNTHHHDDHLAMQMRLLERGELTADVFLTPYERDYPVDAQRYAQDVVDMRGVEYRTMCDGNTILLGGPGGARITFYRWLGNRNPNYSSMMCRVVYGERSMFFLADVCGEAQAALALTRRDIPWKSDILKVGHHGYTAQNKDLLHLLSPELAIVPNSPPGAIDTISQMERERIPCLLTSFGTIYLHTDGGPLWHVFQDKYYLIEK